MRQWLDLCDALLLEKVENFFTPESKAKYANTIYQILQASYAEIGGIKGAGFNSVEDMIQNIPMIKILRYGNTVKGVVAYKDKMGRKIVALGTDGTDDARNFIASVFRDQLSTGKAFVEVSDKCLRYIKKIFTPEELKGITIKPDSAKELLPGDILEPADDPEEYLRNIGGHKHQKRMLGKPFNKDGKLHGAPGIKHG